MSRLLEIATRDFESISSRDSLAIQATRFGRLQMLESSKADQRCIRKAIEGTSIAKESISKLWIQTLKFRRNLEVHFMKSVAIDSFELILSIWPSSELL